MKYLVPLFFLLTPAAAMAAPLTGSATFDAAAAMPSKVVVNGSLWRCDGAGCRGPAEERKVAVLKVCRDLSRKVGAVVALNVGKTTLDAEDLAACNKGAKTAQA